jgi:hypothetical protein
MRCETVHNIPRIGLLLVLAAFPSMSPAQTDVPKWSTHEIALHASGSLANPYTDVSVSAVFTGPGGVAKSVAGFWDGKDAFKIRFTPTVQGVWSYQTRSTDPGLDGKTGSVNCVAPPEGKHGFLRIDASHPYSFVWDDGTRCFMWGQTYYDVLQSALANDNWKTSVDRSRAYGMNKLRLHVYAQHFYSKKEFNGYPDAQPYEGSSTSPDRDRLNIPYWRKLDELVGYLGSQGMVADLIIANPYEKNRMFGTDAQNDRFVKYVVSRYAAYPNVIWCLCNEWNYAATYGGTYPQDKADFDRWGTIVRKDDPWIAEGASLRPLSVHQQTRIDFQFFGSAWPTYAIIQLGVRNDKFQYGDQWGNAGIVSNLGHSMPVVNDEYGYLGELKPVHFTQPQNRWTLWGIAAAGGYGSAGDIRLTPNGKGNPEITGDWYDAPEYGDLKRMIDFFTTKNIEYWKMSSQNSLLTSGSRTYVLAETGRQYVVYAAAGGSFSVKLAAGDYNAWRYDPRTGEETSLGVIAGGGPHSFTMPDANDWVVHLTRVP